MRRLYNVERQTVVSEDFYLRGWACKEAGAERSLLITLQLTGTGFSAEGRAETVEIGRPGLLSSHVHQPTAWRNAGSLENGIVTSLQTSAKT
jgi:hypothetical protein